MAQWWFEAAAVSSHGQGRATDGSLSTADLPGGLRAAGAWVRSPAPGAPYVQLRSLTAGTREVSMLDSVLLPASAFASHLPSAASAVPLLPEALLWLPSLLLGGGGGAGGSGASGGPGASAAASPSSALSFVPSPQAPSLRLGLRGCNASSAVLVVSGDVGLLSAGESSEAAGAGTSAMIGGSVGGSLITGLPTRYA